MKTLTDNSNIDWFFEQPKKVNVPEFTYTEDMPFEPKELTEEHAKTKRLNSERELVTISCYVYDVKTDGKDGDYHLFLSSKKDGTGKRIDAKIPDPDCRRLRNQAKLKNSYDKARKVAMDIKSWTDAGYVVKADITGVPFRGSEYDGRDDVYPNREIHPVLEIKAYW